jgi:hypothetical protein
MKSVLVLLVFVSLFIVAALPAGAATGSAGPSCHPGAGPCQETIHFGELAFLGSPLPGCSTLTEWALIDTVGNGVQHINVNAAQDFWLTSTMEGATTIVQGTVALDQNGNLIFTQDTSQPTFSGHLQQWFGESINKNNISVSGTANFQGTSSTGASASLHFNIHLNTTGSQPILPNQSSMHFDVLCG